MLRFFEDAGIGIWLGDDGALCVSGLSRCSAENADMLREYIREHKSEIVGELSTARVQECLHGKSCQHLDAISGGRPLCSKTGIPISDLRSCPLCLWERRLKNGENIQASSRRRKTRLVNEAWVATWRRGRQWIRAHLPDLEKAGWTRRELLCAGRFKHPCGAWGVAWFWKPDVTPTLEPDGAIRWSWKNANGKTVTKAARPKNPIERKKS